MDKDSLPNSISGALENGAKLYQLCYNDDANVYQIDTYYQMVGRWCVFIWAEIR